MRLFGLTTLASLIFASLPLSDFNVYAASGWSDITTATTYSKDGSANQMTWSPLQSAVSGKATKLRVSIKQFGSPTDVRLGLYDQHGNKLTEGSAVITRAGYQEVIVPPVLVTQGARYFIAAQAASGMLYSFSCGATTGGFEYTNAYGTGLPVKLPTNGWSDKLLTAGMYIVNGPVARFSAAPTKGSTPLTVAFTDSSAETPTSWLWDFGDGTRSTLQNPSHTYTTPGLYSVSLTVTNQDGSDTLTRQNIITVEQHIPGTNRDFLVTIDPTVHRKFGLYYPATFKFKLPATSGNLVAQYRYWEGNWHSLPVKTSADIFNGIDAVRFDYAAGIAYVSVRFSSTSDRIYLRIIDQSAQPVALVYNGIPRYYDNRKSVAAITLDDWKGDDDAAFSTALDYLKVMGLPVTASVITDSAPWPSIQQQIDSMGNRLEIASHGKFHTCDYSGNSYEAEVITSRDDIRNNLTFESHPYVPAFVEPCGYSDATLETWITRGDYLLSRSTFGAPPAQATFAPWLPEAGRYGRTGPTFDDWNYQVNDVNLLVQANATFDQTLSAGTIYLLLDHPWRGHWFDGSYLVQHLNHVKGRPNVWYVPLGPLYQYHFLQEGRGNLSVRQITTGPTAAFTATPISGTSPLSVTFTDSSTGTITSWLWDFGDGTTSTLRNPVHSYTSGTYTVKLTVSGPDGTDTVTKIGYIVVNPARPVAAFTATPTGGATPLSVTFTDLSTGTIDSWSWDFGDGATSTSRNPVHVYTAGVYTVKLTVSGPGGSSSCTKSSYIKVTPKADFVASPPVGPAPLTVTFTDKTIGTATSWLWTFGDKSSSTQRNPVHSYTSAGTYNVKLKVTGPGGSNVLMKARHIVANPPPPVVDFTASRLSGTAPLKVKFKGIGTEKVNLWRWDFGDGTTSTLQNPVHVYSAGAYTVKLTVTGSGGSSTCAKTSYIKVTPKAEFTASFPTGAAPLIVRFTSKTAGKSARLRWDFGDNSTSTQQSPIHTYPRPGTYTVKLTATGPGGSHTITKKVITKAGQGLPPVREGFPTPVVKVAWGDYTPGSR